MPVLMKPALHQSWWPSSSGASIAPRLLVIEDSTLQPPLCRALSDQAEALGWRIQVLTMGPGSEKRTRRAHLRELTQAYDALVADVDAASAPPVKPPVWLVAAGYGAYLATLLSHRRSIDRMLLRSPRVYPDSGWDLTVHSLEARHAKARVHPELASNDNLAFCAAGEYLGQVLIVDGPTDGMGPHGLHVDYFHAFSRARARHLHTLQHLSSSRTADDFQDTLQRWLTVAH